MRLPFGAATFLSFLIAYTPCVLAQNSTTETKELERNIRAELGFLASDAMQERRSGSGYRLVTGLVLLLTPNIAALRIWEMALRSIAQEMKASQ